MEKGKLERVAYWSHGVTGLLGALLFVPYLGALWMAMLWPAQLVPATVAIVAGFFFWPTAILSLLALLMLAGMVSGEVSDSLIAGYSLAAIIVVGQWRIRRHYTDAY
jgi:hypothetical protein